MLFNEGTYMHKYIYSSSNPEEKSTSYEQPNFVQICVMKQKTIFFNTEILSLNSLFPFSQEEFVLIILSGRVSMAFFKNDLLMKFYFTLE